MAKRDRSRLGSFIRAYATAALWSSTDESDEGGGEPLDRNYGIGDLASTTEREMVRDATAFYLDNQRRFGTADDEQAGHDFWLTRNGHGAGYWDRPELYGEANAKVLTRAAKLFGGYDLYVGDDGKIHGSGSTAPRRLRRTRDSTPRRDRSRKLPDGWADWRDFARRYARTFIRWAEPAPKNSSEERYAIMWSDDRPGAHVVWARVSPNPQVSFERSSGGFYDIPEEGRRAIPWAIESARRHKAHRLSPSRDRASSRGARTRLEEEWYRANRAWGWEADLAWRNAKKQAKTGKRPPLNLRQKAKRARKSQPLPLRDSQRARGARGTR